MSFKDRFRDFQRIVWELKRLRDHNTSFKQDSLELFFFAEGTMVLLALERFMRIILGTEAKEKDTLPNLLEKATSAKLNLIQLPGTLSREETIRRLTKVRNTLMHGNYEQAATQGGLPTKDAYFGSSMYIADVEALYKIVNRIVKQIDPQTGQPRPRAAPEMQAYLSSPDFLDLKVAAFDEVPSPAPLVRQDVSGEPDTK